jgi:hypothetical protein
MTGLILMLSLSAGLARCGAFDGQAQPALPQWTSELCVVDNVTEFGCDTVLGDAVSDGHSKLSRGFGKRAQVLAAFGPPPEISWESGRELWCYRLPPNSHGQRLHLTVCYEGWLGMDELYGFTLGPSRWVIFNETNHNPSPPADVWKF